MSEVNPKISVITVVFNGVHEVENTIISVLNQSYSNSEYIVIDGGSTDGTVDIIKKYAHKINYWISEPDNGIYDAMNKGIEAATGLFTIVVNCGDYLYDDKVFKKVFEGIVNPTKFDMIYGRSKIIDNYGNITDLYIKHPLNQLWKGPTFRHGALLAKTSLLKQYKFEITQELKIAADFNFIYKMHKMGYAFLSVDTIIVAFKEDGVSSNPYKHIIDSIHIIKKHHDWNMRTRFFYLKKYLKTVASRSIIRKVAKFFRLFFQEYLLNYWINKIPFYIIRHSYYTSVLGIQLGKGSSIHLNCFLYGRNIRIGENSTINRSCFLDGRGRLTIGNKVSISPHVQLITEDHDYNSTRFLGRSRDINIEDYVWLGTNAMILPGVRIGEGAVVCAGAVVTKDVKPYDVVAGVPAKAIKQRNRNLDYNPSWLPYFD